MKNTGSVFAVSAIPIKSSENFLTNTVWLLDPNKVKSVPTWNLSPKPIVIALLGETVGLLKITSWLSLNGWLGKNIDLAGIDTTFEISPNVNDLPTDTDLPTVFATPIDSAGLK